MGHTLTNHHRVITRQSQPMQQQQAAARSVSPDAAAARRLHDWPELGFAAVLDEVDFLWNRPRRWNRSWQQPRERQFQSAARGGLGRPDGHGTRVDLCNPKVAAHRGKLPRSQPADSVQAEGCTRTRVSPEVEASSDGFARGYRHRGATVPGCDPRRLRPVGTGVTHVLISLVASGQAAAMRVCRPS